MHGRIEEMKDNQKLSACEIITYVMFVIHIMLVCVAMALIKDAPTIGGPDKYGDYARGLYDFDVKVLTILSIIVGLIFGHIVGVFIRKMDGAGENPYKWPFIISLVGTFLIVGIWI